MKQYQSLPKHNTTVYDNCYFEWHGKCQYETQYNLNELHYLADNHHAHVSKNSLQHQNNIRFMTIRETDRAIFTNNIEQLTTKIDENLDCSLLKVQVEYCVFDNKETVDEGWALQKKYQHNVVQSYQNNYPDLEDYLIKEVIAHEAFIRRASLLDMPFMLKGSFVTRQYFANPNERLPADIDFVCLTQSENPNELQPILSEWVQAVTQTFVDDGVYFISFSENDFWRGIDYAMHDDFPTVSTDLTCTIDGKSVELMLDVSLNLDMPLAPVSLDYHTPIDSFTIPKTVPLALQIAWKIHQSIVRPRVKDIYDLSKLALAVDNEQTVTDALLALHDECKRDGITQDVIIKFFDYERSELFTRHISKSIYTSERKESISYLTTLPSTHAEFVNNFVENMRLADFTVECCNRVFNDKK